MSMSPYYLVISALSERARVGRAKAPPSEVAQGRDCGIGPRRGLGGRAVHCARPGIRQGRLDQPAAALANGAPRLVEAQVGETTPPALVLRRQDQGHFLASQTSPT